MIFQNTDYVYFNIVGRKLIKRYDTKYGGDSLDKGTAYLQVWDEVLERFRGCVSGANPETGSEEDYKKGFFDGKLGFDVPSNIAIVIIGMLYCQGDFEKLMQYTINCGEDTDCTAATAGAIYGIIHGKAGIPERWLIPIVTSIKIGCLNLGELGGYGAEIPATIDELVDRVVEQGKQVSLGYSCAYALVECTNPPTGEFRLPCADPQIFAEMVKGPIYRFDFFDIQVIYEDGAFLRNGEEKKITLRLVNTYKSTEALDIQVWAEDTLLFAPSRSGRMLVKGAYFKGPAYWGNMEIAEFTVSCESITTPTIGGVFQVTVPGRHTNMCVPFTMINANLQNYETDFEYRF